MKYDLDLRGAVGYWGCSPDYLRYFLSNRKDKDVHISICSLGGDVSAGLEMYQLIKDHGKVHVHFVGLSASAATFLAMGAASVDMVKNSLILIHNASYWIDSWGNFNKEDIQQLIDKLKFKATQLATIDDIIAECYAERCGKSVDEVLAKMKIAAWIKPTEAKDFGIIDEVRDAERAEGAANNRYYNSLSKEMGLPPFPKGFNPDTGEESDTTGIIQKTVEMLQSLLPKQSAKNVNTMSKFTRMVSAMGVETVKTDKSDNVVLSPAEAQQLEDKLADQDKACKAAAKVINDLKAERDSLKDQVDNLKKSNPENGDKGASTVTDDNSADGAAELWNSIKDSL